MTPTESIHALIEDHLCQRADALEGDTTQHLVSRNEFKRWARLSEYIRLNQKRMGVRLSFIEVPSDDDPNRPSRINVTFSLESK